MSRHGSLVFGCAFLTPILWYTARVSLWCMLFDLLDYLLRILTIAHTFVCECALALILVCLLANSHSLTFTLCQFSTNHFLLLFWVLADLLFWLGGNTTNCILVLRCNNWGYLLIQDSSWPLSLTIVGLPLVWPSILGGERVLAFSIDHITFRSLLVGLMFFHWLIDFINL